MKNKTVRFLCSGAVFLLLLGLILIPLQSLLSRKELAGPWDMTNKVGGFYNEAPNQFDVMFFGSSHAYASFTPLELWEETGVKSYVFATQQQPPWATYTYIKEALKTQSPSLIVVECHMLLDDQEYYADPVTYSYSDEIPLSRNKVELAWVSSPTLEGRLGLLFNFLKYHGRWNELHRSDFFLDRSQLRDPYKGFVMLPPKPDPWYQPFIADVTGRTPLGEKQQYWLEEIITLCQEQDIALWLVKSPANLPPERKALLNSVQDTAQEHGIPFFDFNMNYQAIGIDETFFFDAYHLDALGASRFTRYFASLLEERMPELIRDPSDPAWAADLETYKQAQAQLLP